ncbi:MAG: Grx4 family monothiol glutaredoxin [Myxococcota bacterium]
MTLTDAVRAQLQQLIDNHEVVLFMKGTRALPQCGFSSQVVSILDDYLPSYETVNVLADPAIRQGIKDFSDWPTIPQLYVKGEFVGGCDIVRDMHGSGELAEVLGVKPLDVEPPTVTITDSARAAFAEAAKDAEYEFLRLEVGPQFQYGLSFGPRLTGDVEVNANGMLVLLDRGSARRAGGLTIDFVTGPGGEGFKIENPNEPPKVRQMTGADLKRRLEAREALHLFDVRPADERAIVSIAEAVMLDEAGAKQLAALPKDALIVFQCRSGRRSQAAAEQYLTQGFTNLWNLEGGILAWADLHPGLPKY